MWILSKMGAGKESGFLISTWSHLYETGFIEKLENAYYMKMIDRYKGSLIVDIAAYEQYMEMFLTLL